MKRKGIAITMPMDLPTNFLSVFGNGTKTCWSPYVLGSPPKVTLPETKLGRAPEGKTHLPTNPSVFEVLSVLVFREGTKYTMEPCKRYLIFKS